MRERKFSISNFFFTFFDRCEATHFLRQFLSVNIVQCVFGLSKSYKILTDVQVSEQVIFLSKMSNNVSYFLRTINTCTCKLSSYPQHSRQDTSFIFEKKVSIEQKHAKFCFFIISSKIISISYLFFIAIKIFFVVYWNLESLLHTSGDQETF